MPTTNPRVNVTLSPSLDALVGRMAGLQRVSKSQVLRELLEAAEPALQRAVALMDAAAKAHTGVLAELQRGLERAQTEAEDQLTAHLAYLDSTASDLVATAEGVRGRRPRTRASAGAGAAPGRRQPASDPPASNRGVKSPPEGLSSPSPKRRRGVKA